MDTSKIKNIIYVVFLGALGSGLWNFAGEPTAGFIYETILSFGGWGSIAYANFINSGIGSGGWEDRGSALFMISFVAAFAYFMLKKILLIEHKFIKYALVIFFIVFFLSFTLKTMHSHKATLYFHKNIDILAPYVEPIEILKVKSLYRQIDDLNSFDKAQDELINMAQRCDIKIGRYSL